MVSFIKIPTNREIEMQAREEVLINLPLKKYFPSINRNYYNLRYCTVKSTDLIDKTVVTAINSFIFLKKCFYYVKDFLLHTHFAFFYNKIIRPLLIPRAEKIAIQEMKKLLEQRQKEISNLTLSQKLAEIQPFIRRQFYDLKYFSKEFFNFCNLGFFFGAIASTATAGDFKAFQQCTLASTSSFAIIFGMEKFLEKTNLKKNIYASTIFRTIEIGLGLLPFIISTQVSGSNTHIN